MHNTSGILIVGYGKHIENKILPAITELGIPVLGIISQNPNVPKNILSFKNLNDYKKINHTPSHIFICTEPTKHLNLVRDSINLSKNIMVEKPFIIDTCHQELNDILIQNDVILKEAMMYRYNILNKALEKKRKLFNSAKKIELNFVLPSNSLKKNSSFRNKPGIRNSILFDIGCYIYDFIWNFDVPIKNLVICDLKKFKCGRLKSLYLKSTKNKIYIKFGYGNQYSNQVKLTSKYNNIYTLTPFFYGRDSKVRIIIKNKKRSFFKDYSNLNCFYMMINDWYYHNNTPIQKELKNFNRLSFVQNQLFKLSEEMENLCITKV